MAILKYANQSGVVYAYESVSEWDPIKKQSRSKRKCLGKVDPETGQIIPTSGRRGRPPKNTVTGISPDAKDRALESELSAMEGTLNRLKAENAELLKQNRELLLENKRIKDVLSRLKKELSEL